MTYRCIAVWGALAGACLVSGCAVYPYPGVPIAYGDPYVTYNQYGPYGQAPVMVAPAPVYYGPAYPAIYPSISIYGRFGGHGHRHGDGRGRR